MSTELKVIEPPDDPKPTTITTTEPSSSKDNQPLLKPDPIDPSETETLETLEELEKKYSAYVRNDVYGAMGRGELPWWEKLKLGVAMVTLVPIRLVLGFAVLLLYYLICRLFTAFAVPNREDGQEDYAHMVGWRRVVIIQCGRFLSRVMFFLLGFYWIGKARRGQQGEEGEALANENQCEEQSEEPGRPGVIVSNHISYLDILYHMSSCFPSFVAKEWSKLLLGTDTILFYLNKSQFWIPSLKRSVAKLPLVGLISKCLGCVYVQRESKSSDFKGVSGVVSERVLEAHRDKHAPRMMLFPEGTTTNGNFLLPFKTGAFLAKAPVLPVILRYPYKRFSPAWDSITGVRHVLLLLCQFVNHIEVKRLPIYYPSEQEKEDPKLYAINVRNLMAREGNLTLSDIGLAEKRVYHAALNGNNRLPTVLHQKED